MSTAYLIGYAPSAVLQIAGLLADPSAVVTLPVIPTPPPVPRRLIRYRTQRYHVPEGLRRQHQREQAAFSARTSPGFGQTLAERRRAARAAA